MILVFGIWRFTNIHKIKLPLSDAAIDSCKKLVANVVLEFLPSMQWGNNQLAMSPFHCQLPMLLSNNCQLPMSLSNNCQLPMSLGNSLDPV